MAVTDWKSPGTMAEVFYDALAAQWTSEDNAKTQNDTYAQSLIEKEKTSQGLAAMNYSFGIPAGSTINGIETRYEAYSNCYALRIKELLVRLTYNGSIIDGVDKATGVGLRHTDSEDDTYVLHGGASDMWSTGYGYSHVTHSTFGVIYRFNNTDTEFTCSAEMDHIQIRIYYTLPGYGNDVNDVPSANIASINDVLTANIETVNDI